LETVDILHGALYYLFLAINDNALIAGQAEQWAKVPGPRISRHYERPNQVLQYKDELQNYGDAMSKG